MKKFSTGREVREEKTGKLTGKELYEACAVPLPEIQANTDTDCPEKFILGKIISTSKLFMSWKKYLTPPLRFRPNM